jgi:hypothetical protein
VTDDDRLSGLDEPLPEDRQSEGKGAIEVETPRPKRPTTEVPTPRTEELRAKSTDVDPGVRRLFWKLIALYKVAILGFVLGVLFWVFGSHPTRGPALVVGGTVLFVYALVLTRRGKARLDDGEFEGTEEST